jgi:hypothetical protein
MCLFLTALLRDGRIGLDEYGIEIREFCVNYLWVVEAAEVTPDPPTHPLSTIEE